MADGDSERKESGNHRRIDQFSLFLGIIAALAAQALYDTFKSVWDYYYPNSLPWAGVGFGFGVSVVIIATILLVVILGEGHLAKGNAKESLTQK